MKKKQELFCQTIEASPENLGRLIGVSYRHMSDYINRIVKEHGYPSFSVQYMAVLKSLDVAGTTVNQLADKILITKQAVSKMVKDLEKNGYVVTRKNPNDSRSVLIFSTPQTKELLKFIKKQNQKFVGEVSATLGEKRMQAFISDFHTVMSLIINRSLQK